MLKCSNYNFIYDCDISNSKYAFNALTCSLAEINEEFIDIINSVNSRIEIDKDNEIVKSMIVEGFLIDYEVDEKELIKYKHNIQKYCDTDLNLTIAPTLECNFLCEYCYEKLSSAPMSDAVAEQICQFAKKRSLKSDNINVFWYGGEPLLNKSRIYSLSESLIRIAQDNGCKYEAFMVTNGYLLDTETIRNLEKCKITKIQITLDGPQEIHDDRRMLKKSKEGTFNKILENLLILKESDIETILRINIDKTNLDYLSDLLQVLDEKALHNLRISLGQISAITEACKCVENNCLDGQSFSQIVVDSFNLLLRYNFAIEDRIIFPQPKTHYCGAQHINSFVVDPNGYLYKCWDSIGHTDEAVGNLAEGKLNSIRYFFNESKWLNEEPFKYKECIECNILPLCIGGCPKMRQNTGKANCDIWKYSLSDFIFNYIKMQIV